MGGERADAQKALWDGVSGGGRWRQLQAKAGAGMPLRQNRIQKQITTKQMSFDH
jgi:hypothetical protein